MRTKFRLIAALVAIVALGVLVSAPAASANAGDKKFKILRIVAELKQEEFLDGDNGPSLGDQFVLSQRLYIRGRQVGESGVVCFVTQAMPPYDVLTFKCEGVLKLRKGQITLQGLIEVQGEDDPGPFRVAITGGTGAFRCACGEAVIRFQSETRSVYRLRLDFCKKRKFDRKKFDDRKKYDDGKRDDGKRDDR